MPKNSSGFNPTRYTRKYTYRPFAPCAFQLSANSQSVLQSPCRKAWMCNLSLREDKNQLTHAALEKSHLLPRRKVRLVKFLPALLHFPGNCTNHELIRNNEPAHRGRKDNSEQQQRELMEKYILIAQCRRLSLQARIAPREVSPPGEGTRTHTAPTPHRNTRQRWGGLRAGVNFAENRVGSPDTAPACPGMALSPSTTCPLGSHKTHLGFTAWLQLQCLTPAPCMGVDHPCFI